MSKNRDRDVSLANARVSRRREEEAAAKGDKEGAEIQARIAADYERDADFWDQVGGGQ